MAEVFDATVHGLVGVAGKGPVACEGDILILLEDGLGGFVQFNGHAVTCFDCSYLNVVALNIGFAEVVGIGVAKAGKAAEEEDVSDGLQARCSTKVQISDLGQFLFCKVNDFVLRLLESGFEGLESVL